MASKEDKKNTLIPPSRLAPKQVQVTAPSNDVIKHLSEHLADKTRDELAANVPNIADVSNNWLNESDDGLKPAFTLRMPDRLSAQLRDISEQTDVSQNYLSLEATWVSALAKLIDLHPGNVVVKDSVLTSLKKSRRGWRGRTLLDVLDEQIELLTKLRETVNEQN